MRVGSGSEVTVGPKDSGVYLILRSPFGDEQAIWMNEREALDLVLMVKGAAGSVRRMCQEADPED